jgi:hypothetical protein
VAEDRTNAKGQPWFAPETQRVNGDFGRAKYGQALFVPDARKSEAEVGP